MIPHTYFERVKEFYDGNEIKSWKWWKTANPAFNMFSPLHMCKMGREKAVMNFIDQSFKGNN